MSFWKKKQQPVQPASSVTITQTPSQALAQIASNASKDGHIGQQPPSGVRSDSALDV
jgi:hypothetical protein